MTEKYYSPKEVAEMYNIAKSTVTKVIREGKLKAIRFGNVWRIPESALQDFIKESMEKGDTQP